MTMEAAWESFQKAVSFEEKSLQAAKDGKEGMARIALKAADKHLNEAVRLEAEALAA